MVLEAKRALITTFLVITAFFWGILIGIEERGEPVDKFEALYEVVDSDATIKLCNDPFQVKIHYPDCSTGILYWRENKWNFEEEHCSCPCDVAARDAL